MDVRHVHDDLYLSKMMYDCCYCSAEKFTPVALPNGPFSMQTGFVFHNSYNILLGACWHVRV